MGATTVNKVCGSGLKAVMLADQAIRLGEAGLVIAGGMECVGHRTAYLLTRARQGYRLGHGELLDALILDGLWDVYGQKSMGVYGDVCACTRPSRREAKDDFAVRSFNRARKAIAEGVFRDEIVPIPVTVKGKTTFVSEDEGPAKFDEAKLRTLKPASNSPKPMPRSPPATRPASATGPAALLVASAGHCKRFDLKPAAPIVGEATHSQEPDESRRPLSTPSGSSSRRSAGPSIRSICSRSTKPSRSSHYSPSDSSNPAPKTQRLRRCRGSGTPHRVQRRTGFW